MSELLKQQAQAVPGPFAQSFLASCSSSPGLRLLLLRGCKATSEVFRVSGRFLGAIASSVQRGAVPFAEIVEGRRGSLQGEKRRGTRELAQLPANQANFPPNRLRASSLVSSSCSAPLWEAPPLRGWPGRARGDRKCVSGGGLGLLREMGPGLPYVLALI